MFSGIAKALTPSKTFQAMLLAVVCFLPAWAVIETVLTEMAQRRGVADAKADVAQGNFIYRLRGLARGWDRTAISIARKRYSIQIVRTGGCVCAGSDCAYDHAYNNILRDHLLRKFGFDPINKAFELAREQWQNEREVALSR